MVVAATGRRGPGCRVDIIQVGTPEDPKPAPTSGPPTTVAFLSGDSGKSVAGTGPGPGPGPPGAKIMAWKVHERSGATRMCLEPVNADKTQRDGSTEVGART